MQSERRGARWAALLLAGLAFGAFSPRASAQDPDAEFRNGVAAFEQGRFEEAEQHFRNVLKSKPDHEQALRYRDEAGYRFWVKVLAREDRLATVAKRILKAAEKAAIRERQDAEQMREDIRKLWADDFMEQVEATERLIAKYGHYVVPELMEVLKDRHEDEKRVRVISLLARLGEEGTLALVELLESDDIFLQQNTASILGHIRDVRAVPPLKRLAAATQDPHVREACNTAISRIEGPDYDTPQYYARVAEAFYQENPLFMVNRYKEHVVWKWRDGQLTYREVPNFRWNEEVAEEYAYDGLKADPNNQVLWATLLNVYAQEWTEIEVALRSAQEVRDKGGDVDEEELEKMRELQQGLAKLKMLVASRGPEGVLAALGKALADQRAPVAVFLIERLQDMNVDPAQLAGGGAVTFLPPEERTGEAAPAPKPAPAPAPTKPAESTQPSQPKPAPTKVEDDGGPPPLEDDGGPPPLEDDGGPPPLEDDQPRRRPRRVSKVVPQERGTHTAFGFRAPAMPQAATRATELSKHSPAEEILTGGAAFSAALSYGDKRVRYAAAIAAAHLNPAVDFGNMEQVMPNLVDALGESGQRVVLVVERDRHNRNRLVGLLRELGYMTFGVDEGREGLIRAKTFPAEDLIIVSSELNPDGLGTDPLEFQFIDDIKDDYRTRHMKVMVLTPEERVSTMQTLVDDGKALDVLTPNVDKATLADKLTRAFGSEEDQRDEKARSDKIAERAALAVASLRPGHTKFDLALAGEALTKNVRRDAGRPDSVRLACLKGLESVGPAAQGVAVDVLVREFKDETNSVEVRRGIARALGEVVKGSPISGDTFQVLLAALASDDEGIWDAAGHALGKAQLTGEQAVEVFEAQRIE